MTITRRRGEPERNLRAMVDFDDGMFLIQYLCFCVFSPQPMLNTNVHRPNQVIPITCELPSISEASPASLPNDKDLKINPQPHKRKLKKLIPMDWNGSKKQRNEKRSRLKAHNTVTTKGHAASWTESFTCE